MVDLRRWIQLAALLLPGRSRAVTTQLTNNDPERKGRVRVHAVLGSDNHPVPVALGGSGKPKPGCRMPGAPLHGGRAHRMPAVTGAHAGAKRPKGGHLVRYRLPEAMRLQGCPPEMVEQFGEHHPFRADAALKMIANGVPVPLGRALARAIKAALAQRQEASA